MESVERTRLAWLVPLGSNEHQGVTQSKGSTTLIVTATSYRTNASIVARPSPSIAESFRYHVLFVVRDGERCHYPGVPSIVNISEHQFAERELVQEWINMMLVAWWVFNHTQCGQSLSTSLFRVSATNCAQIYNMTHPPPNNLPWDFSLELKTAEVWTGFVALSVA